MAGTLVIDISNYASSPYQKKLTQADKRNLDDPMAFNGNGKVDTDPERIAAAKSICPDEEIGIDVAKAEVLLKKALGIANVIEKYFIGIPENYEPYVTAPKEIVNEGLIPPGVFDIDAQRFCNEHTNEECGNFFQFFVRLDYYLLGKPINYFEYRLRSLMQKIELELDKSEPDRNVILNLCEEIKYAAQYTNSPVTSCKYYGEAAKAYYALGEDEKAVALLLEKQESIHSVVGPDGKSTLFYNAAKGRVFYSGECYMYGNDFNGAVITIEEGLINAGEIERAETLLHTFLMDDADRTRLQKLIDSKKAEAKPYKI